MFLLLRELAAAGDLQLAGLAHVNHQIRGAASDHDEAFCRALAARAGVPIVVAQIDVPALARAQRQSIEVAARHARHRALHEAAAELGADRIATAHTRDDQAETVLLHLTRGAGLSGARGIEPLAGDRIRPLLDCARAELQGWLRDRDEPWREDESNADVGNPRNRLRHLVLPALREHFNPALDAALARFADILREDHDYLTDVARTLAAAIVVERAGEVAVAAAALARLPRALARRVARVALETVHAGRSYDLEEVDAVVDASLGLADAGASSRADSGRRSSARDLSGVRMERSGEFVVLRNRGLSNQAAGPFAYELPIPGSVAITESRVRVEAEGPTPFHPDATREIGNGSDEVVIRADELGEGVLVRNRRAGDRLQLWQVGRKKVQDLFVDRKVERLERDRVPIVTDRAGRIIWVAGHALDAAFRVGPATNTVVTLKLRPLETGVPTARSWRGGAESAGRQR